MNRTSCPVGGRLQVLLEEGGVRDDADELVHHLDSCSDCQETLQELAAPPDVWACTARGLMDKARAEPTLHHLVERLKGEAPLPAEDSGLSFLRPIDKPGVLGLLDRFEVQEEIGRGGMGVVLKALDPNLNRIVAIKVLSPWLASNATARRRFVREAKAAAAVCHDHIVTVYGVEASEGLPYLVMQYVAGESLQVRLDRTGSLEVEEVVHIGLQTARGLAAAHAQGLIHRDIKPANLLLENGVARIKITDFGLARMVDDVGLTQDGVIAGTPAYMAPEQARGETVDHRADLFSLGSVLYACCTGIPPFRASTALAMLSQVSEKEPMPIRALNPDVPVWLESFICQLMAKDPAQRFPSAAEAADLIEGYLAHLRQPATILAPPLSPPSPGENASALPVVPSRPAASWLRPALWIAAALVLLASLGLLQQLAGVDDPPAPKAAPSELYLDFRGGKFPSPSLYSWTGREEFEVIASEEQGLRITLPAERKRTDPVGLVLHTTVTGDFEITTGYELLGMDRPQRGNGVGYELYVTLDTPSRDAIAFARVKQTDGSDSYHCVVMTTVNQNRKYLGDSFPAISPSGRLRLTRRGAEIGFLVAEGDAAEFREIYRHSLSSAGVNAVRLAAYPGQSREAVDVRVVDVKVHADVPIIVPDTDDKAGKTSTGMKKGIALIVMLGLGLTIGLTALAVWFRRSRRNRDTAGATPTPTTQEKMQPEVPVPSVSFPCSGCGKPLKARSALAGKKVKCPQCSQAVQVPSIKTESFRKP